MALRNLQRESKQPGNQILKGSLISRRQILEERKLLNQFAPRCSPQTDKVASFGDLIVQRIGLALVGVGLIEQLLLSLSALSLQAPRRSPDDNDVGSGQVVPAAACFVPRMNVVSWVRRPNRPAKAVAEVDAG